VLRKSMLGHLSGELFSLTSIGVYAKHLVGTRSHSSARLDIGLRKREHSLNRPTCFTTEADGNGCLYCVCVLYSLYEPLCSQYHCCTIGSAEDRLIITPS